LDNQDTHFETPKLVAEVLIFNEQGQTQKGAQEICAQPIA
jgi:hypothetical protein